MKKTKGRRIYDVNGVRIFKNGEEYLVMGDSGRAAVFSVDDYLRVVESHKPSDLIHKFYRGRKDLKVAFPTGNHLEELNEAFEVLHARAFGRGNPVYQTFINSNSN